MNKDISNNIEYFEENKTKNDKENDELIEKIKKYIKIYLGITTVIFIIFLIGNSYDNRMNGYPKSTFKIIKESAYYSYLIPIAIIAAFAVWFFSISNTTSIAGVKVSNSSSIGISDFVDKKTSNKEKMTNIDKPNNQSINTATTISQTSQINNNQSNIIPQKSLIDIPKKSISNIISPSTKENISSFKSDAKALLSKTMNTIKSSNSPNVSSNKPVVPVKNTSSNRPNVSSNRLVVPVKKVQPTRNPIVKSPDNISQSTRNVNALPNKTPIAIPVNNNIGGANDDNLLTNIIIVSGIGILSYILYMLYNELIMLNKIKKDEDEKNKIRNKLILTSNIIV